jgi:glucan phosphoethanolaminetransferase (alkaline phosphatase superfamily)
MRRITCKVILLIIVKYIIFYIWQFNAFSNTRFDLGRLKNFQDVLFTIIILSILPIFEVLLLTLPLGYWVCNFGKIDVFYKILSFAGIIFLEILISVFLTNAKVESWIFPLQYQYY